MIKSLVSISFVVMFLLAGAVNPVGAQCESCPDGSPAQIDFNCQRAKLFDPTSSYARSCTLCACGSIGPSDPGDAKMINLNLFGINLRLDSGYAFGQLIYLGFTFFFGVIALAAVGLGIFGAVKRAQAENEDDIATSQKIITNAIIGLVTTVIGVLAAQLVAVFLGVPTINEIFDLTVLFGR